MCYPGQNFDMSVPVSGRCSTHRGRLARPRRALPRPARDRTRVLLPQPAAGPARRAHDCPRPNTKARPLRRAREPSPMPSRRDVPTGPAYWGAGFIDTPVYDGTALGAGAAVSGPALIEEPFTVIVSPPATTHASTSSVTTSSPSPERARRPLRLLRHARRKGRIDTLMGIDRGGTWAMSSRPTHCVSSGTSTASPTRSTRSPVSTTSPGSTPACERLLEASGVPAPDDDVLFARIFASYSSIARLTRLRRRGTGVDGAAVPRRRARDLLELGLGPARSDRRCGTDRSRRRRRSLGLGRRPQAASAHLRTHVGRAGCRRHGRGLRGRYVELRRRRPPTRGHAPRLHPPAPFRCRLTRRPPKGPTSVPDLRALLELVQP